MTKFPRADDPKEVEDVLSSIRRLVSEEARGVVDEALDPDTPDTLMLTPELRVVHERPAPLRLDTPVSEPRLSPETMAEAPAPFEDEVALRALVKEVIREELQGELGSRITRNVRKLIKREIADALSSRS